MASPTVPSWKRRGYSIAAIRKLAAARLPRPVFDFSDGAAEDERTLRRNEAAFADIDLVPHPLSGAGDRDASITLLGHRLTMPVTIGPTGLSGLFWPDGERCAARAAKAAGIGFCLSHGSVCTIEGFAETGLHPRWMQTFIYRDRGFTREFAERAAASGYDGLVLTIDNQLGGNRERDVRNGFTIPPRFRPIDLAIMATKLGWIWSMRRDLRRLTFANYVRAGEVIGLSQLAGRVTSFLDPSMTWADVDELRRIWKGNLILKGILSPAEAAEAARRGVDAVIVSNHGGRQLDGAIAALDALPAVVAAVAGAIPVLVDGGIRRGSDVVKALALGAACCLIARPQLWGLAVAGEAGVAHVLDIFRREIDRVMGLCGVRTIADVGPELLSRVRLQPAPLLRAALPPDARSTPHKRAAPRPPRKALPSAG